MECVQDAPVMLRNLRDVILRVKPEGSYCHPGGFTDGRRVNECEPSPVSEQIEHTKTECLYAKLCEREVNPRQLISGAEHTSQNAKELLEEGNNNKINCNIHRASGRVSAL